MVDTGDLITGDLMSAQMQKQHRKAEQMSFNHVEMPDRGPQRESTLQKEGVAWIHLLVCNVFGGRPKSQLGCDLQCPEVRPHATTCVCARIVAHLEAKICPSLRKLP